MRTLLALALLAPFAVGDPTIKDLRLGKIVLGPEVKVEDLKDKVVLIEAWGLKCGPCIAAMPHIVSLHEELSDFGLVVIGLHRQQASSAELKERCTAMNIRFSMFDTGFVQGSKVDGIPHCSVFDNTGKIIHDGRPTDVDAKLRPAVGAMLVSVVDKPTKAMQPVVDALKKGSSPYEALKKLNTLKSSGDKATVEQAKLLSERILEGGRKRLEKIRSEVKDDPIATYETAVLMAARWKGFETGTKAAELVSKLKVDKAVVAELKARPTLEGIKKLDAAVVAATPGVDYQTAEFKKKYGVQVRELKKAYESMKQKYPDARATKEAFEIVEKYDQPAGK